MLKKFYEGKPVVFLARNGELAVHRFNIPVHAWNEDDVEFGYLYMASLREADASRGSFEV